MRDDWMEKREEAVELFEKGRGYKYASATIGVPRGTVMKWFYTYRALGKEALLSRKNKTYSYETKLAAARDVVDAGMTKPDVMVKYGIRAKTQINDWCRLYLEGGEEALLPKKKGRRPKSEKLAYASREEELEARIQELELENELLKRINALADEIEQRRHPR